MPCLPTRLCPTCLSVVPLLPCTACTCLCHVYCACLHAYRVACQGHALVKKIPLYSTAATEGSFLLLRSRFVLQTALPRLYFCTCCCKPGLLLFHTHRCTCTGAFAHLYLRRKGGSSLGSSPPCGIWPFLCRVLCLPLLPACSHSAMLLLHRCCTLTFRLHSIPTSACFLPAYGCLFSCLYLPAVVATSL